MLTLKFNAKSSGTWEMGSIYKIPFIIKDLLSEMQKNIRDLFVKQHDKFLISVFNDCIRFATL